MIYYRIEGVDIGIPHCGPAAEAKMIVKAVDALSAVDDNGIGEMSRRKGGLAYAFIRANIESEPPEKPSSALDQVREITRDAGGRYWIQMGPDLRQSLVVFCNSHAKQMKHAYLVEAQFANPDGPADTASIATVDNARKILMEMERLSPGNNKSGRYDRLAHKWRAALAKHQADALSEEVAGPSPTARPRPRI
ncbi:MULTISPECIES: hypothetical protein [unclassified Thioalkalivibrio]|uniref:hypothetical protein n=1 Tax=unclassified Thioalkalivibrio TaxID=2621013 RepID=UPI00036914B8|nr:MULTISPECIES: hypothetical protein [unclassified Thioalkalivibrio]